MKDKTPEKQQVLIEITQIGGVMRVTAVDPETGIEAVIQGPVTAGQGVLRETAMKKLAFLMSKKRT